MFIHSWFIERIVFIKDMNRSPFSVYTIIEGWNNQ